MRRLSAILSILLIVVLICLMIPAAFAADSYVTLYGFSFDINSRGEAVIHAYDDRALSVAIPAKLLGAPVAEIDSYAFYRSAVTGVSFDGAADLCRIGDSAFSGCVDLSAVKLPDTVAELGFGAFQNCTALADLTLGGGLTAIPAQCFYGCTALTDVTIPSSVLTIGDYAFSHCTGLVTVTIPEEVTEIAETAFDGLRDLTVRCVRGSYADEWAGERMIRREYLDGYYCGDADADGEVTILDATAVQRYLASFTLTHFSEKYADADCDGSITILDATTIQRYLAGFDTNEKMGRFIVYDAGQDDPSAGA